MKNNFKTKPELLAPAGSFDCLKAAVQNGADAVYLGLKTGSARMGAENFTFEELAEAVYYAHIRGVRVYLALNTLIFDEEFDTYYETAKKAASLGVDALILQDLGLAAKIIKHKAEFGCEIHASTQMSVYNLDGVKRLKELGFDRCITARELSLEELSELCSENILEIEAFCHGALCMSLSGQCLMSSFIGGRSGNRGTCAQPCRKKYSLSANGNDNTLAYRLSPADFASIPYIEELITAGVHSLKIEGRLKSPEYVAVVTRSYREAIDNAFSGKNHSITKNLRDMQVLFGRGDFTSGYLKGKLPFKDITFRSAGRTGLPIGKLTAAPIKLSTPKNLPKNLTRFCLTAVLDEGVELSTGDGITVYTFAENEQQTFCGGTVNSVKNLKANIVEITVVGNLKNNSIGNKQLLLTLTDDAKLRESLAVNIKTENKKCPVFMRFTGNTGEIPILEIFDTQGHSCATKGPQTLQKANNTPTSVDEIKKQLSRLGDTPFYASEISADIDDNVFIPVSVLNSMRRDCIAGLIDLRKQRDISVTNNNHIFSQGKIFTPKNTAGGISLFFYTADSFLSFKEEALPEILSPYSKEERTYYIPVNIFYKHMQRSEIFTRTVEKIRQIKNDKNKIIAYLPFISLGQALKLIKQNIDFICENYLDKYLDGFLCENLGDIELLKGTDAIICCDYSFNTANKHTLDVLSQIGISRATLSVEAVKIPECNVNCEIVIGGPIVLMRSRHCYIDEGECSGKLLKCEKAAYSLKDSFGCEFRILPQKEDCCSILLSHKPVSYTDSQVKKIRSANPNVTLRVNIL
ncbi:MAG: U32 family peptidase [Clostridia bacterium]|nr:U32 family peptidase [Clostridia bacterium]